MKVNWRQFIFYLCCLLMTSIVYSKFLLSVSIISFFILAIYRVYMDGMDIRPFSKHYLVLWPLLFITICLSGLNSSNTTEWMHQVQLKLPYLVFPFSLWVFKDILRDYYHQVHQVFILIIGISLFPVYYEILADFEGHLKTLGLGQSANTPVDHIKYSIFLAFSALSTLVFLIVPTKKTELFLPKWLLGVTFVFIFVLLHLLAVRSGLILFYAVLFIVGILIIIQRRKWLWMLGFFAFFFSAPAVMYHTVPCVKAKIGYMRYEFN